ncbi:winged helix-turn-helix transcriptional regulator [Actinomadura sp. HBU206391]|uniref:winged helix-turn-helix transcriptional regulator n=1 Tax=Actinomadura sp. HBU206391 TaxID=2731692 RepID=UPI00164F3158|nr:winged helix-turn-helix transcriptional regulator [Actinomadura sp. HBU206391]MBC6458982.1 transcriptional regulator [Actinomadura sp. HBU206391]
MSGRRSYGDPCGVARGLDVIGERWALLVVRDLLLGPKRFNDLLGGLPGVSPNVLSQRLVELIERGVVHRRDLGAPTRVRLYELTPWGRKLEPILLQLGGWGSQAPLPPDGELGIDSLMLSLMAGFDQARAGELQGIYEFLIDGATYVAEVADGLLQIRRGTVDQPDATLTADVATLRAICAGRTSVAEAVQCGDLRLDGDRRAVQSVTDLVLAPLAHAPEA